MRTSAASISRRCRTITRSFGSWSALGEQHLDGEVATRYGLSRMRNGAMRGLPTNVREVIERGELTTAELRALIRHEAQALGLTFRQAVRRARTRTLPRTHLGADIELLVTLLPASA